RHRRSIFAHPYRPFLRHAFAFLSEFLLTIVPGTDLLKGEGSSDRVSAPPSARLWVGRSAADRRPRSLPPPVASRRLRGSNHSCSTYRRSVRLGDAMLVAVPPRKCHR